MQWELIATWAGLGLTTAAGIYKMDKQAQRIDNQEEQLKDLKIKVDQNSEIPVKLAVLETDVKYILANITEIKDYLLQHSRMVEK